MVNELLKYSYENNLGHIPSALSMLDYLEIVFQYIKINDNIVIGKPFGSQAYYLIWKKLGWLENIHNLHIGVKHEEINFVNYSEETIGNALGVAAGISLASEKKTYVNITDGSLQMGNTLEAIQFIGQHKLNILVTVDFNDAQVIGKTSDIINVNPVINFFRENNFNVYTVNGHDKVEINNVMFNCINISTPVVIIFFTRKGFPFLEMENDIKKWHYRKLNEKDFIAFSKQIQK